MTFFSACCGGEKTESKRKGTEKIRPFLKIAYPFAEIPREQNPLPDKGNPVVRRGRKATDQAENLIAGFPKEDANDCAKGWGLPRLKGVLP